MSHKYENCPCGGRRIKGSDTPASRNGEEEKKLWEIDPDQVPIDMLAVREKLDGTLLGEDWYRLPSWRVTFDYAALKGVDLRVHRSVNKHGVWTLSEATTGLRIANDLPQDFDLDGTPDAMLAEFAAGRMLQLTAEKVAAAIAKGKETLSTRTPNPFLARSETKDSEPSEEVIEAMADCLLKTFNTVTREEIIAAWRVATGFAGAATRATDRKPETFASGQQPTNSALSASAHSWIDEVIREITEMPDRTSPEDFPEAMLVTAPELRRILEAFAPRSSSVAIEGLPASIRKRIEQACNDAENPKGMSTHNGYARVQSCDVRRLLKLLDLSAVSAREGNDK